MNVLKTLPRGYQGDLESEVASVVILRSHPKITSCIMIQSHNEQCKNEIADLQSSAISVAPEPSYPPTSSQGKSKPGNSTSFIQPHPFTASM